MTPERWERIEALFHAAEGKPPEERATFLAAACSDDDRLRREVEALLDEPKSPEEFLGGAPLTIPARIMARVAPEPMTGRTLGQYELQALLGSGGMGEVYRASDRKLGRDVAIKVLPAEFQSDPNRLARFEREARMLAALNHPNVCGIYGLEEDAGIRFLVLELVEGETLDRRLGHRLPRGAGSPLVVQDALNIARQIAQALEVAHERGVVHRDLKPANVKITPSHVVKVLDFGLAKEVDIDGSRPGLTHTPAGTQNEGRAPVLIGTAAYMSPEQARGLAVDTRTDIWAFGVVLFEMLAGRSPFRGETTTDTVASILRTDPPWTELPPTIAPDVRRLLHRCLRKDPTRRLQSIADARVRLEDVLNGADTDLAVDVHAPAVEHRRFAAPDFRNTGVAWTVAAIAIVAAAGLGVLTLRRPDAAVMVFSILAPAGASLATEEAPIVSPDGRLLAFVAYDTQGTQRLYVGGIGSAAPAHPLPNTEGASLPFWSPTSQAIAFFGQGWLKTTNIVTGSVRSLAKAGAPRGGTWNQDGVIVYVPSPLDGPYRVSAASEDEPRRIASEPGSSPGGWFPSFLPGGRHFLEFVPMATQPENSGVWVVALDTGHRKRLVDARSNAVHGPGGSIFFWNDGTLWSQLFDAQKLEMRGSAIRVADAVGLNPVTNQALFSVTSSGTIAYLSGAVGQTALVWFDRKGLEIGRPGPSGIINTVDLSPDDTKVVYDLADPRTATFDLWQLVFGRRAPEKLTFNSSHDLLPVWSPDGQRIAFMSVRERPPQVYEMRPNVSGSEQRLFKIAQPALPSGWSRDGKILFFTVTDSKTATGDVWSISLDSQTPRGVVTTPNDERYGTPSPDGRWLAYASNESGTFEVYVRAHQGPDARRKVSAQGGSQPQWRRDGRELFYLAPDRALMAVDFASVTDALTPGPARRLFPTQTKSLEIQGTARTYAVSSDGQRFLVANATDESKHASIRVILHHR